MPIRLDRRLRPELSVEQILAWADAHHRRTGAWPTCESGRIPEARGEKWRNVYNALRYGLRGLPSGYTLAQLLIERRAADELRPLPPLTVTQILAWADAHRAQTGHWPTDRSGPVVGAARENWSAVDAALRRGHRSLPGGSSLAGLLVAHRGVRNRHGLAPLTLREILAWADAHHRRTGSWPKCRSGPIPDAPGETWSAVDTALVKGQRGLPGGSSLARLLARHRGVRNPQALPRLTQRKILAWADAHFRRAGAWPHQRSGPVVDAPGETWSAVDTALSQGGRGLPGGSSLAALLAGQRGVRKMIALDVPVRPFGSRSAEAAG
jgi:hypothetical protein